MPRTRPGIVGSGWYRIRERANASFDRTRHGPASHWADLEEMAAAGSLDVEAILGVLVRYLGGDDERVARLRALSEDRSPLEPGE